MTLVTGGEGQGATCWLVGCLEHHFFFIRTGSARVRVGALFEWE